MSDYIIARTSPGWGVKCAYCKQWITKWDWTQAEAYAIAKSADHKCTRSKGNNT